MQEFIIGAGLLGWHLRLALSLLSLTAFLRRIEPATSHREDPWAALRELRKTRPQSSSGTGDLAKPNASRNVVNLSMC